MTAGAAMTIKAKYENGVLRPIEPLPLREGETVDVTLAVPATPSPRKRDPKEVARILREIAAIPPDGPLPNDGLQSSRDHDKILYGGPKGAA
jgi:predicted DNA-binding antitoxin AbrB/MazE fold protein